jgi:hypothetical protein
MGTNRDHQHEVLTPRAAVVLAEGRDADAMFDCTARLLGRTWQAVD